MAGADYEITGRGFKHYQPINSTYGHLVKVYESSAAASAHLWLAVDSTAAVIRSDDGRELAAHLTLEQAEALAATLRAAIDGHYQHVGHA